MAYSIKKHEVDRLLNVSVVLGWTLVDEKYENLAVEVTLRREISPELAAASGELEVKSSPQ